jgi:hypothetical protein
MTRILGAACAAVSALVSLVVAPGPVARAAGGHDERFSTWIERQAPGAFDPASHATVRGMRVAYRMDADVLLPLWVTSLEIFSRANVGMATAFYRDLALPGGQRVRAFEFFTTSLPERARGIDRMGFFREALGLSARGIDWTAYFGTMTASPEQTLEQAERAVKREGTVAYEVTNGFSTSAETTAGFFDVDVDRHARSADELYSIVRPMLDGRTPSYTRSLQRNNGEPLPPRAFLEALQVSLHEAAASPRGAQPARAPQVSFVHNGRVHFLVVKEVAPDASRGRDAVAGGFAGNAALVYRFDFRITSASGEDGRFRLWAELPLNADRSAGAEPIPPIAFELTPRSFLRLHFDRVR